MRICIDLDGVICELRPDISSSYSDLKPMPGAIEKIKSLKDQGHYIIIYTARRMKTHHSNLGAVVADIGFDTIAWLKNHGVIYDEIYFGKPWAEVYIDDNAYRFNSWDGIAVDGSNLPISNENKSKGM